MPATGRPREFVLEDALDRAIEVFWRQGYEGTTLDDLTRAMKITRPSLYAAFGNKESTFRSAIERYAVVDMAYIEDAIAEPTARAVAEHYLHSNVRAITMPGRPPGCLSIQGGLASSPEHQRIVDFLNQSRAGGEARFVERFQHAIDAGDLPSTEQPQELARYLVTVAAGLAVQATSGTTRDELERTAARALLGLPDAVAANGWAPSGSNRRPTD